MFHGSRTQLIRDYRGEKRKGGICSDECSNRKHKIAADLTLTPTTTLSLLYFSCMQSGT